MQVLISNHTSMLEIAVIILDIHIHSKSAKTTENLEQFYQLQSANLTFDLKRIRL